MSEYISRPEFEKLYDLLKKRLLDENPGFTLPKHDIEIIGWGIWKEKEGIYIRNFFPELKKNPAGYLYTLSIKFKNPAINVATITLKQFGKLLNAIGVKSYAEFKKMFEEQSTNVTYHCIYYSFTKAEIQDRIIKFIKTSDNRIEAVLKNFYNLSEDSEIRGEVTLIDKTLIIDLRKDNRYLNIQLQSHEVSGKSNTLPTAKVLQGQISGIATDGFLINLECILLNEELYKKSIERSNAYKYLILKRRHHRVMNKEVNRNTTNKLIINRVYIDAMANMAGTTYRLWNYSYNRKIIYQSKFTITKNYLADIETPNVVENKEALRCHITIIQSGKLLVNAFINNSLSVSTIVNIPEESNSIEQGVFCTVGGRKGPGSNFYVMRADKNTFGSEKIETSKLTAYINRQKNKKDLIELKEELDKLPFMSKSKNQK